MVSQRSRVPAGGRSLVNNPVEIIIWRLCVAASPDILKVTRCHNCSKRKKKYQVQYFCHPGISNNICKAIAQTIKHHNKQTNGNDDAISWKRITKRMLTWLGHREKGPIGHSSMTNKPGPAWRFGKCTLVNRFSFQISFTDALGFNAFRTEYEILTYVRILSYKLKGYLFTISQWREDSFLKRRVDNL